MFEQIEYNLPDFWASAIINDDWSGLSDEESNQLRNFLESEDLGDGHWNIEDQEAFFMKFHDAIGVGVLACDCFLYIWNKRVV